MSPATIIRFPVERTRQPDRITLSFPVYNPWMMWWQMYTVSVDAYLKR